MMYAYADRNSGLLFPNIFVFHLKYSCQDVWEQRACAVRVYSGVRFPVGNFVGESKDTTVCLYNRAQKVGVLWPKPIDEEGVEEYKTSVPCVNRLWATSTRTVTSLPKNYYNPEERKIQSGQRHIVLYCLRRGENECVRITY